MANLARSVVERSVYSSGTVEYEEPIPPDSEDGEGSENYEEPRSQWTGSQDIESSGYIIPEHRPEPLTAVSSTASCQSHFHSKSSGLQLLGVKNKGSPAHKGKGTKKGRCRVLFLVVVLGIILVGLIALVLGAVAVKGKLCRGDVSCSSSDSEEESVMRSEFARLQEQIQSLKSSVLSARFNSSDLYMGCIPMTHVCTVLPLPEGYLVEPRGPVCTTQRLRIEVRDTCCGSGLCYIHYGQAFI